MSTQTVEQWLGSGEDQTSPDTVAHKGIGGTMEASQGTEQCAPCRERLLAGQMAHLGRGCNRRISSYVQLIRGRSQ